jgi:alpha-L-fucosidase 2
MNAHVLHYDQPARLWTKTLPIGECLIQGRRGRIDLLPAVPDELADGFVTGLVARPGIEVDLR